MSGLTVRLEQQAGTLVWPPGEDLHGLDLFDLLPDAVLLVDASGLIRHANARALRLFGNPGPLAGQPVEALLPTSLRERHAQHRAHYAARLEGRPMETSLDIVGQRSDGSRFAADILLQAVSIG